MAKTRIISFNGQVNEISSLRVIIELLDLNSESETEPIYIYINSNGGSIIHGLAIYDTINHIKAPVYTVCTGLAASMGAFLLSCGAKGHRSALRHSKILIHQPLIMTKNGFSESETALRKLANDLQKDRETLEKIMSENTNKPLEKLHKDCERDNWLTAEEALQYGLIDSII